MFELNERKDFYYHKLKIIYLISMCDVAQYNLIYHIQIRVSIDSAAAFMSFGKGVGLRVLSSTNTCTK